MTLAPSGTSRCTTAPAATMASRPIDMPGSNRTGTDHRAGTNGDLTDDHDARADRGIFAEIKVVPETGTAVDEGEIAEGTCITMRLGSIVAGNILHHGGDAPAAAGTGFLDIDDDRRSGAEQDDR